MDDLVPKLTPRPLSPTIRLLSTVHPGIRVTTGQIEPYTAWWDARNQDAANRPGPLLVAVGDSTAIGIGASAPGLSYVGVVHRQLVAGTGRPWRIINLSLAGARLDDALARQLPAAARLRPDLVVCCVGTNDLMWGRETTALRDRIRQLVDLVPESTLLGTLAGASPRARMVNRALRRAARERDLPVLDPWAEPGPPGPRRLAADRFHPNDLGYALMAAPFCRALGVAPAPLPAEADTHTLDTVGPDTGRVPMPSTPSAVTDDPDGVTHHEGTGR